MQVQTKAVVSVRVGIDDTEPWRCGGCGFQRAGRCSLYKSALPFGRNRVAECLRDTPLPDLPYAIDFAHVRGCRHLSLDMLQDIVGYDRLDAAARRELALLWQGRGIRPQRSFCAADTDTTGYGPTDSNGFFMFTC